MKLMENPKFCSFIGEFAKLMESTQQVSLDEARRRSTAFFCPPTLYKEPIKKTTDILIPARDGHAIPVRLYTPEKEGPLPVFIYYHRGGWVFCNIEEADPVCRKFANHLGVIVASVDYRLAPEHPYPLPLHDCYDAYAYIAEHAKKFGGDPSKVMVGGESAGGNLAGSVALQARDNKSFPLAAQLLIYPIISSTLNDEAYKASADQYFLTKGAMEFFWGMYVQDPSDRKNPYVSLECSKNLKDLPPALVITAEHDPLHVEAEHYAKLLMQAGNKVLVKRFKDVIHGFFDLPIYEDTEVIAWMETVKSALKQLLF